MKTFYKKLSLSGKLISLTLIFILGYFFYTKFFTKKTTAPQYQTAQAERGTLIVSLTTSGQVSSANTATITTQATGVIKKLYVQDGDKVKSGQKIAEIDLDLVGRQNASSTYASYLSAKNSLTSAQNSLRSAEASLAVTYDEVKGHDTDETLVQKETRTKSEVTKDNAYLSVVNAQANLSSSWLKYQQSSPIIYAPISGTIAGLSLQPGAIISSSETKIANIKTASIPTISVSLTEIDVPKVKVSNKATITLDALPDKTYTGKVIAVDTSGTVSSGVVSYTATIKLDTDVEEIFPNMSATANIITDIKDNIIMVPAAAVQTSNGTTTVRKLKDGQLTNVPVEIGKSSSTQVEIISGVNEGDTIITSIINPATSTTSTSGSIFGGGNRGFGGAVRRMGD